MGDKSPSPLTEFRFKSPISFDVLVDRIEVNRHFGAENEEDDELRWDVYLYSFPDRDRNGVRAPNYLLVGHLFRSTEAAHAQVRANGLIRAYEANGQAMDTDFVRERMAYGFVEPVYDACRRAIEVQGSIMDLDLELPKMSPATKIHFGAIPTPEETETEAPHDGAVQNL
ncbi:hypothetical protein [Pseudarthrobacter sp. LT1]|uniref:hypothetical protein n=1 Tax=Pseudarthrobacter sp. LT1 TaxID=3111450 RepID=UPI002D76939D|nr:hypothetical protein [Pseudarthrobacter sp. LT1]WRT15613.1 hypothetical protein VIK36_09120 [Pseudarthrobacter sp. LT1]